MGAPDDDDDDDDDVAPDQLATPPRDFNSSTSRRASLYIPGTVY